MMKDTKREIRQSSSIHQKIRSASFVDYDTKIAETFKYNLATKFKAGSDRVHQTFKRIRSLITDKSIQLYNGVIWDRLIIHMFIWFVEAFIEGLTFNYALYVLVGFRFDIFTIFAYGILIKQSIDIYLRLKVDGTNTTVSEEDKHVPGQSPSSIA